MHHDVVPINSWTALLFPVCWGLQSEHIIIIANRSSLCSTLKQTQWQNVYLQSPIRLHPLLLLYSNDEKKNSPIALLITGRSAWLPLSGGDCASALLSMVRIQLCLMMRNLLKIKWSPHPWRLSLRPGRSKQTAKLVWR